MAKPHRDVAPKQRGAEPDGNSKPTELRVLANCLTKIDTAMQMHYCLKNEFCGINSRHLEIEVSYENRRIYTVETVYTQLL